MQFLPVAILHVNDMLEMLNPGSEEMVQQLGALAAISEDPGLVPSIRTVAHNCLQL